MTRILEIIECAIKNIEQEKKNVEEHAQSLQHSVLRMERQWKEEKADHDKTKAKVFRTKELMNEIVKVFGSETAFENMVSDEVDKQNMRALWRRMISEDWEWSW